MAVLITVGGKSGGDGFLLAPLDSTYDAEIALSTSAGTASVTLQALAPNPAGLVFSTMGPIALSTTPTIVMVHATVQSGSRQDTTIQVLDGATVVASFTVTSIKHAVINFSGRFEARFATDGSLPFKNPMFTATQDTIPPPTGWTWGLEGEPQFVPAMNNIPENLETTGLGRVIRLNNPISLRSHAAPVVSIVASVTGNTASGTETFTAGDPLIGEPVNFGPDTYFAGNNSPSGTSTPHPEEYWGAAREPLALFQIKLGTSFAPPALYFSGASKVGPFVAKAAGPNVHTRMPDSRPIANGQMPNASAEFTEFGLSDHITFGDARMDALIADYNALPAGPSTERRNLNRRIGFLLSAVSTAKFNQVQGNPPGPFTVRSPGTLLISPSLGAPPDWYYKEHFVGKVDTDLHASPGGSPGASSVVDYLRQFFSFDVSWDAFAFHSDELCGYHKGTLTGDVTMTGNHIGDPHCRTVNGIPYDFQGAGEFTLLRDGNAMEIQARQTPVAVAKPVTDSYSGLTSCVSLNTAVAARVGTHRISLQPGKENRLQFYLDGKPAQLTAVGIDLGGNRVSGFDANGQTALRVDYEDGTVFTATPMYWNAYKLWYIDVSVSNTRADEGVMGYIPKDSWLPRLRNGKSLGPMPPSLQDRYVQLYRTFAKSWRVTNKTSLFVYAAGTSTATFTDVNWPAEKAPCKLLPQFRVAGVGVMKGMPVAKAQAICRVVTDKDLYNNCVFDVASTGDETFAKGYRLAQDLRLYGTAVKIEGFVPAMVRPDRTNPPSQDVPPGNLKQLLAVIATVVPLHSGRPTPTGTVTFFVDGVPLKRPIELDAVGQAEYTVGPLEPGDHQIRVTYTGGGEFAYHSSTSPNLVHTVALERPIRRVRPIR
jgi:hypothetical protein